MWASVVRARRRDLDTFFLCPFPVEIEFSCSPAKRARIFKQRSMSSIKPKASLPVAVERAYDIWLWLEARLVDFPVAARHGMGRHVGDAAVGALDALLEAAYAPRGSPATAIALERANQRLALLRLLLRGARERRYLSIDQHNHAIERLSEVGKMVGGWLKSVRRSS